MAQPSDLAHGLPLRGVVLCSTSVPQETRTRLADYAVEMGAVHKLDLTGDVTHLLVGDVKTPKYRYVAKSRPDIRVLTPEWVEEVHRRWLEGEDVDIAALEEQCKLPALFGLHICLTGFTDVATRNELEATVLAQGAKYSGDLSKLVTHLIVAAPQGAKYTHARQWGMPCVSLKWLTDSLTRTMALDESLYDPETPESEQGKGAFKLEVKASTGKRTRDEQPEIRGKRKFRRTASTRLEEHSQDLWQDISAMSNGKNESAPDQWKDDVAPPIERPVEVPAAVQQVADKLFSHWRICLQGFDAIRATKLKDYLVQQCGAEVVDSASQLRLGSAESHCIIIPHVPPQSLYYLSKPINQTVVATEWWVERCIHAKRIIDVESDALSKPFWAADLPDMAGTNICSTGLNSIDLRQTATVVKTLGATYHEAMTSETTVLISASAVVKKEKAFYANKHNIPVVTPEWLWSSIQDKRKLPFKSYRIKLETGELSRPSTERSPAKTARSEPRSAHRGRPRAQGPFIHEDEDTGPDSLPAPSAALPLQEVSPNLSSPKKRSLEKNATGKQAETAHLGLDKMRSPEELIPDIASLSKQLQESRSGKAAEVEGNRRKKRTLGRAASAISNRSYSAEQAIDERRDLFDEPREAEMPVAAQPSTQLGYEVPEAEAHREQMAKRMGTTFTDDTVGKKLASIGTVRDTEVQTRSRRRAGR